ncbi:BgTH12-05881 [Blumeria graminis f. sp. triticale]|uniref:Bgt-3527 n=3 Tax=Blumeria graminis TaxID=34373 RepID=A0A061HJI1_BLUGR|nr:Poly(A)+ RNA-binding protein [Blumeria graminis f. sp. tritici 96224]CAD6504144.1 BgTH12-05881 [Blumeria graminis f. sp. triticale]VDB90910.1 Bgt-3527 [Blumeria graminis f. sp. tritici]
MSHPLPPGLSTNSSTHQSSSNRPSQQSFNVNSVNNSHATTLPPNFNGFAPRSISTPQSSYNQAYSQASYQPQQHNNYASLQQHEPSYGAAPQIRNPFAPPSASSGVSRGFEEDPELAAQIAQWQSAYVAKENSSTSGYTGAVRKYPSTGEGSSAATSANAAPLGGSNISSAALNLAAHNDTGIATVVSDAKTNTKTVVRSGGGTTWTDSSLLEWDPLHFRLFVGNLAGEVTDESLFKAFSRWPSVQKARVIRDKRTTKSKGYGFVSFSDGDEFFQAARDMQGKYIGSHPVLLRRSTTEIKAVNPKDQRKNKAKSKGKGNQDKTGAGVHKPGSKVKGGLRLLG